MIEKPDVKTFCSRLAEKAVSSQALDQSSLERAERAAWQTGSRLDIVLIQLGLLPESEITKELAAFHGIPVATAMNAPSLPVLPEALSAQFVKNRGVLPLRLDGATLHLAIVDPFDQEPAQAVAYLTGHSVVMSAIGRSDFDQLAALLYPEGGGTLSQSSAAEQVGGNDQDIRRLTDLASEAPVVKLANQIVFEAVGSGASDIHIEPKPDELAIRYRIDGHLRKMQSLPPQLRDAITSRIKILAKLNIAERRLPQDGRLTMAIRGIDIDFRVSTVPTLHGESVVLRILDKSQMQLSFEALGFSGEEIKNLRRQLELPNGIFLVTGPTGSGKTTTLYTALKEIHRPGAKLFTVEDPVEYQLAGVNQLQIAPGIGLDFPHALRSILRQDPDIIMIGEIRDQETARIAIQSALTGHLVLSTIHTNGAFETLARLKDMGGEDYLLAATINGVLAQRLTRRLCLHCAEPHKNAGFWEDRVNRELGSHLSSERPRILQARGCSACGDTGYHGRIAISELLEITTARRNLITQKVHEDLFLGPDWQSLYRNGLMKAWAGLTTVEEVMIAARVPLQ